METKAKIELTAEQLAMLEGNEKYWQRIGEIQKEMMEEQKEWKALPIDDKDEPEELRQCTEQIPVNIEMFEDRKSNHEESKQKTIIIINGSNGVGKDTFVKYFKEISCFPVANYTTIGPALKLATAYGVDGKSNRERLFYHRLNSAIWEYDNGPLLYLDRKIAETPNPCFCFVHCREAENICKIIAHFLRLGHRVMTLLVERETDVANNSSDRNVSFFPYQYKIENNGSLKSFLEKIEWVYKSIVK